MTFCPYDDTTYNLLKWLLCVRPFYCDSMTIFQQGIKLYSTRTLVAEQSRLESSGLHSVVRDARKRLSTSNQRRCRVAWVYCVDELDQRVTDTAVRDRRTHLHACIKAKGRYFEHSLH